MKPGPRRRAVSRRCPGSRTVSDANVIRRASSAIARRRAVGQVKSFIQPINCETQVDERARSTGQTSSTTCPLVIICRCIDRCPAVRRSTMCHRPRLLRRQTSRSVSSTTCSTLSQVAAIQTDKCCNVAVCCVLRLAPLAPSC